MTVELVVPHSKSLVVTPEGEKIVHGFTFSDATYDSMRNIWVHPDTSEPVNDNKIEPVTNFLTAIDPFYPTLGTNLDRYIQEAITSHNFHKVGNVKNFEQNGLFTGILYSLNIFAEENGQEEFFDTMNQNQTRSHLSGALKRSINATVKKMSTEKAPVPTPITIIRHARTTLEQPVPEEALQIACAIGEQHQKLDPDIVVPGAVIGFNALWRQPSVRTLQKN